MAKSVKTIKQAPALKAAPDQTYLAQCRAILAFNRACNAEIMIDTENMTVSVTVTDSVAGKQYAGTAALEEVE